MLGNVDENVGRNVGWLAWWFVSSKMFVCLHFSSLGVLVRLCFVACLFACPHVCFKYFWMMLIGQF